MTRLEQLSQISNAVLTPHMNYDLENTEKLKDTSQPLLRDEDGFRQRWVKRQMAIIGCYGAVLCG